ncbi:hypothetical protein GIB67_004126 [Kingdonia uniflora]|uniref:Disease resistance protein At4g27190-like leucine-rich repeats domain-containing protein n=1 Tax=Kingdonia uniflora TaxID=39325 RepID=A0A7J7NRY4_9MAGN|nr:hypothetical protein GIB67_004126 [Kingdonia uniflora]
MSNDIREVPADTPECSQLVTLSLASNRSLKKIPAGFFGGMKCLATLDLSHTDIEYLPQSFSSFNKCLRSLYLDCCTDLQDISLIGNLKTLEILGLQYTSIPWLPEEISGLTNLKMLNLTNNYKNLKCIPPKVISSLSNLEELCMLYSFGEWEIDGTRDNASLAEVASLAKLTSLYLDVENEKWLSTDIGPSHHWEKLEKFILICNIRASTTMEGAAIAVISVTELAKCAAVPIVRYISYVAPTAALYAWDHIFYYETYCNDLQSKVQEDLLRLEHDVIGKVNLARDNRDVIHEVVQNWLKMVIDVRDKATQLYNEARAINSCFQGWGSASHRIGKKSKEKIVIVDKLLRKVIWSDINMERSRPTHQTRKPQNATCGEMPFIKIPLSFSGICTKIPTIGGRDVNQFISNLKKLQITDCYLKYIFPIQIFQGLLQLEELEVSFCDDMEELFEFEECLRLFILLFFLCLKAKRVCSPFNRQGTYVELLPSIIDFFEFLPKHKS